MRKKAFDTIAHYQLISQGDRILVGVSGGPDSLALLHFLAHEKHLYGVDVIVVHVNHQFRGGASDQDERVASDYAAKWGVPFYSKSVDVPAYIAESKLNPQVAARNVRYAFFREIAEQTCANKIALAQHADDQAETVLMRIVRGTGLEGLGGIPVHRKEGRQTIIRPFLEVQKDEILSYCETQGIKYRIDQSNLSRKYFRNQVRLDVIPFLEQYNSSIKQTLIHLSEWARDENEYIIKQAQKAMEKVCSLIKKDEFVMDRPLFTSLEVALQRRVVKLILSCLSESPIEMEGKLIERVRDLIENKQPHSVVHLKNGVWFHRTYEIIRIHCKSESVDQIDYSYLLDVPGEVDIPEWGGRIRAKVTRSPDQSNRRGNDIAIFDMDYFHSPLEVRNRREGDRIHPRGLNGTKKVKDMFINAKIPKLVRQSIPHIVFEGKIIWVTGIRASSYGAPTDKTTTYMCLEFERRISTKETE